MTIEDPERGWEVRWGDPAREHKEYGSFAAHETVDVCVTVRGRSEDASQGIADGGGLLGIDSAISRPDERFPVEFVDWPFRETTEPSWERHLEVVRREQPTYATAPDVDQGRDPDEVFEFADRLDLYADTVVVVPKVIEPRSVPSRFRVGLPFQKAFGGVSLPGEEPGEQQRGAGQRQLIEGQPAATGLELADFQDAGDVHVLGGSPAKQRELLQHGIEVGSVDGANIVAYARGGRVWTPSGQISRGNPEWTFQQRVRASVEWMRAAWNPGARLRPSIMPTDEDWLDPEAVYDPYISRAPPPCQRPGCVRPSIAATRYTYCDVDRDTEPELLDEDLE